MVHLAQAVVMVPNEYYPPLCHFRLLMAKISRWLVAIHVAAVAPPVVIHATSNYKEVTTLLSE